MTDLEIQLTLNHSPETIFAALTEATKLSGWFAEAAAVDLGKGQISFWGRYTPETPDQENGRHPILAFEPKQRIDFEWVITRAKTAVSITLHPRADQTVVKLIHSEIYDKKHGIEQPMEDFWLLSLENLRRYLDGRSVTRFDFSATTVGDIQSKIEIDASAEKVFEVITNPEQLKRWIAHEANVELRIGGRFDIGWGEGGPLHILDLVPNEKISYVWSAWSRDPETITTWTLEGSGGKTYLTLVQSGFAPDNDNHDLQIGWLNFMGWVRSICEYGPNWSPPVKRLIPEHYHYYPASMIAGQPNLL